MANPIRYNPNDMSLGKPFDPAISNPTNMPGEVVLGQESKPKRTRSPLAGKRPITQERWDKFLGWVTFYAGNVTASCLKCNIHRTTVFDKIDKDPVFAEVLAQAKDRGIDVLEDEATRRANNGVDKGVYFQGQLVAVEKTYSEPLMGLLLKANRPEKYAERRIDLTRQEERVFEDLPTEELEEILNKKTRGL